MRKTPFLMNEIDGFWWQGVGDSTSVWMQCWKAVVGVALLPTLFFVVPLFFFPLNDVNDFSLTTDVQSQGPKYPLLQWDYYPDGEPPHYGIVIGTTSDKISGRQAAQNSIYPCIAELYARRHKYAFTLVTDLEHVSNRSYGDCHSFPQWNKIKVLQRYLDDVQVLLWVDLDAVITQYNTPLHLILPDQRQQSACNTYRDLSILGIGLSHNISHIVTTNVTTQPFLWMSMDLFPAYTLNANTAVIALRNSPAAKSFLQLVWEDGDDVDGFKRHDDRWSSKPLCKGYYGWPWEQGGVWNVLTNASYVSLLRGTCLLPNKGHAALNSVQDYWKDASIMSSRPFITHKPDVSPDKFLRSWMDTFDVSVTTVQNICPSHVAELLHL